MILLLAAVAFIAYWLGARQGWFEGYDAALLGKTQKPDML
jgi:hypothetical protein